MKVAIRDLDASGGVRGREMLEAVRVTVFFSGHVQGVGFRYTTYHISRRYKVVGYVRNLPDGRVELVAEGSSDDVERFVDEVARVMNAYITGIERESGSATGEFESFRIAY